MSAHAAGKGLRLWCGIGGVYYYPRPAQAPAIRGFLDQCAAAGIRTLLPYFSFFHSGEPALLRFEEGRRPWDPTAVLAPLRFYAEIGWDPIAFLVDEARRRGLQVIPYTAPDIDGSCFPNWHSPVGEKLPILTLTAFANEHPEMWARTAEGEDSLAVSGYVRMSFGFDEARAYRAGQLAAAVRRYAGAGIELEFLAGRGSASPFGFETPVVRSFEETYGRPPASAADEEWLRHCTGFTTRFLRELRQALPAGAILSAAVAGEPAAAYRWGHDWPAWAREGLVDVITLRLMTGDLEAIAGQVRAARQALGDVVPLVAQLCCWGERRLSTAEDILRAAHIARDAGADVVGIYRADGVQALGLWPALRQLAGEGL
jgi:hypothetical protein